MDFDSIILISDQVEFSIDGKDVLVKTPFKIFKLAGEEVEKYLIPALPILVEGTSVAELIEALERIDIGLNINLMINTILRPLIDRGWLVDGQTLNTSATGKSLQTGAIDSLGLGGNETLDRLSVYKIAVVGLSHTAETPASELRGYFSTVHVYLPDTVEGVSADSSVRYYDVNSVSDMATKVSDYDFVVVFETKENSSFERELNEVFYAKNIRFMFSRVIGFNVSIGPAIIPGKTGCLECLNFRAMNNNSFSRELMQFYCGKKYGQRPTDGVSVDHGALVVSGSLISVEIFKFILLDEVLNEDKIILDMPQTFESVIEYNSFTCNLSISKFLKNPRCPVCGSDLYIYPESKPWMRDYTYPANTNKFGN